MSSLQELITMNQEAFDAAAFDFRGPLDQAPAQAKRVQEILPRLNSWNRLPADFERTLLVPYVCTGNELWPTFRYRDTIFFDPDADVAAGCLVLFAQQERTGISFVYDNGETLCIIESRTGEYIPLDTLEVLGVAVSFLVFESDGSRRIQRGNDAHPLQPLHFPGHESGEPTRLIEERRRVKVEVRS